MSHVRQQIRDAIVTALSPLGQVFRSRVYPAEQAELPVFLVYSGDEELDGQLGEIDRRYNVVVEAVDAGDVLDDVLDVHLAAIEAAVSGTLSGLVVSILPTGNQTSRSSSGNRPIGRIRINFEAVYRTSFTDPETSI